LHEAVVNHANNKPKSFSVMAFRSVERSITDSISLPESSTGSSKAP
jgi:hypothetical protein